MSYRLPEDREQHHHYRHIVNEATESLLVIDNGTISRISIPCVYEQLGHHKMWHDHVGWPSVDRPDNSCQLPPGYDRALVIHEINLPEEGYQSVEVAMLNPPSGLSMTGFIDYDTIKLTISALCQSAKEEDVDVKFSVYAIGSKDGNQLRDVVTKGILHINAGII